MPSVLAWLDYSATDHSRAREIIAMFLAAREVATNWA